MKLKNMFILFKHTPGDDLFPPSKIAVMASADKNKLQVALDRRAQEREAWLSTNVDQLPAWANGGIVTHETIEETANV